MMLCVMNLLCIRYKDSFINMVGKNHIYLFRNVGKIQWKNYKEHKDFF